MQLRIFSIMLVILIVFGNNRIISVKVWQTVYLDRDDNCNVRIENTEMDHGDFYLIQSDRYRGSQTFPESPNECSISFDFGERQVVAEMNEWICVSARETNSYIAVYEDCEGYSLALLGKFNCSSLPDQLIPSKKSCLTLYHHRGSRQHGYYVSLKVIAKEKIVHFQVGSMAAFVFLFMFSVIVIMKCAYVVFRWEAPMKLDEMIDANEEGLDMDSSTSRKTSMTSKGSSRKISVNAMDFEDSKEILGKRKVRFSVSEDNVSQTSLNVDHISTVSDHVDTKMPYIMRQLSNSSSNDGSYDSDQAFKHSRLYSAPDVFGCADKVEVTRFGRRCSTAFLYDDNYMKINLLRGGIPSESQESIAEAASPIRRASTVLQETFSTTRKKSLEKKASLKTFFKLPPTLETINDEDNSP